MRLLLAAMALFWVTASRAGENADLDLIPDVAANSPFGAEAAPFAVSGSSAGKLYVEDAVTAWSLRQHLVVPLPPAAPVAWQNRSSMDGRGEWKLADGLRVTLSDRFNVLAASNVYLPAHQEFRNDLREAFVTWEPSPESYLEIGRLNLRNGAALGYSPTDFFKTRSLVDQASLDPSVIREDRLGTFVIRAQRIFEGGSASIVYAPKLTGRSRVYTGPSPSVDPMFDRTNGDDRFLLTLGAAALENLTPEVLVFHQGAETRAGANLSAGIGEAMVAYGEWAGGCQASLADRAEAYGKRTGTLPAFAPNLLSSGGGKSFRNDLVLGASLTSAAKVTVNIEYQFHQSGFSARDWRNWFEVGQGAQNFVPITGALWYLRAYAADQEEPMTRQQAFVRADWTDAFVRDLELSAFAFVSLTDASVLTQLSVKYFLSDAWTMGLLVAANIGDSRTEHGSLRQVGSGILQMIRYF